MSLKNAEDNLKKLSLDLKLGDPLKFDADNTCILGVDNKFSVHITYEPTSNRLYIYAPISNIVPTDINREVLFYRQIFTGTMLGSFIFGGGIGIMRGADNQEWLAGINEISSTVGEHYTDFVLAHSVLDMDYADNAKLANFVPKFVDIIGKWRKFCDDFNAGKNSKLEDILENKSNIPSKNLQDKPTKNQKNLNSSYDNNLAHKLNKELNKKE